ncbi:MAG: hypothetical protein COU08_01830 [Candidatus Harrisonbacteria bacterium CG10_big_fil_rev_8_21_14_0_10_42_17]|uniref:Uncharacterized protein n=1 Tax=Candidatus Harrisonbacteria bacterium CG10_big_fil_rev_8_21_14_0_10_42_17 TaxID=1974584 RepID=A0A2M6WIB9_9BACT|nr:MAG: hypothetical protein COU08_01830 [Candidatus Harrisonbacteria bacterium CG10_big_fil_rev_8_21_14_0_10_42_17]
MVTKLKLRLWTPILGLAFKALIFFALFSFMTASGFSPLAVAIFIIGTTILYSTPFFNLQSVSIALVTLILISVAVSEILFTAVSPLWLSIILTGLFFIILGIKNVIFLHREAWYHILYFGLLYLLLITFFLTEKAYYFFFQAVLLGIVSYMLFREFIRITGKSEDKKRERGFAGLFAWILVQWSWVVALLPLTFINAANTAILLAYIIGEMLHLEVGKTRKKRDVLSRITLAIVLLIMIFGSAKWSI